MSVRRNTVDRTILAGVVAITIALLLSSSVDRLELVATGSPQLLSIQQFPTEGEMCVWPSTADANQIAALQEDPNANLFAALQQGQRAGGYSPDPATTEVTRQPTRMIRDTYPTYSYVAVGMVPSGNGNVVMTFFFPEIF